MAVVHAPQFSSTLTPIRILCAAVAAVILVDAYSVQAGGLALLALPFAIGAIGMRRGRMVAVGAVGAFAALYVYLAVGFSVSSRFDAGWGDLLFAYGGGPVALAVVGLTGWRLLKGR